DVAPIAVGAAGHPGLAVRRRGPAGLLHCAVGQRDVVELGEDGTQRDAVWYAVDQHGERPGGAVAQALWVRRQALANRGHADDVGVLGPHRAQPVQAVVHVAVFAGLLGAVSWRRLGGVRGWDVATCAHEVPLVDGDR